MHKTLLSCFLLMVLLGGCVYQDEPTPVITEVYKPSVIKPRVVRSAKPKVTVNASSSVPVSWRPPTRLERKWTAIVIHHSATKNGNSAIFDKWHREGNHWEGVGYDFVIGNGTNSSDGLVEVTFRWRKQKTGAHCGGTAGNWANTQGIGICLVGNFSKTSPTNKQMQSLAKLVRFLQARYGIPKSRIYGHGATPGARNTDCPGRRFPMKRFKTMLK